VNYVDVDNTGGARMAVEHLIRLGHKRIATITGPLTMASGEDRLAGYRQALEAHWLSADERLIVEGEYTEGSGAMGMRRLLPAAPTAVFVASDVMAIGALKTLREVGRRARKTVALIGFDDVNIASASRAGADHGAPAHRPAGRDDGGCCWTYWSNLPMCTLLPVRATATRPAQRIVLPTELVVRGSCGASL
jgi:DNA-binding LacI/PurR family transcriptional regulator